MDPFELLVEAHRPGMKTALARLVELLRVHEVRYVIGGASALSLYVRPRMTIDIDAFVDPKHKDELDRLLSKQLHLVDIGRFHSKFKDGDVEIDILYAGAPAENFAIANARDAVILGTRLKAASPEALLWLYLVSENEQNFVDAVNLVRAQADLGIARVRAELEHGDPRAREKLDKVLTTARQPASSYEAYRARRS